MRFTVVVGFSGRSGRRRVTRLPGGIVGGHGLTLGLALALLSLAAAGCVEPPSQTATATTSVAPTLESTPTPAASPIVRTAPDPSPTPAATPTSQTTLTPNASPPSPTPTLVPEWEIHDVAVNGSTVVVDLRVFAGTDVSVKLNGQEPDDVSYADGILTHVFQDVEPGRRSVLIYDAAGPSVAREIVVEASSTLAPAATPVPDPTVAPTPLPKATPTPTSEESIENALAEYIPWYSDPPYPLAVVPIREIWHRDADLGRALAQAPWVIDGLDLLENDAIYGLGHLVDYDPALARRMLAYSMEEPVRSRNTWLLGTLGRLSTEHKESFDLLIGQPWFADGLDAEERAFITAVSRTTGIADLYRGLLAERYLRSASISLPLAGDVDVWVFSNDAPSPDEDIPAAVERGARGAERLMDAPFPWTDLIILSLDVDEYDIRYGGVNWGDSMVFLRGERLEPPDYGELLYHEIAHFWLSGDIGPLWLYEGGANLVAAYVKADGQPLVFDEIRLSYCRHNGVPNILALSNPDHPNPVAQITCGYSFGEYFLTTLLNTIGEAAFSSAMRELYEAYLDYQPYATDEQIYRIFLKHTPPDREEAFLDVYRRLHGGPFIDGV